MAPPSPGPAPAGPIRSPAAPNRAAISRRAPTIKSVRDQAAGRHRSEVRAHLIAGDCHGQRTARQIRTANAGAGPHGQHSSPHFALRLTPRPPCVADAPFSDQFDARRCPVRLPASSGNPRLPRMTPVAGLHALKWSALKAPTSLPAYAGSITQPWAREGPKLRGGGDHGQRQSCNNDV